MTEQSMWWSTSGTGDGPAGGYTRDQHFGLWRRLFVSDNHASQGPLKGYNGELAVTAGAGKVTVATGAAIVYGIPYETDASVDVTIPTPVSATRIDRIVLRASWSAQTVRITRIAGTEGGGAPAITQSPGTTFDIKLAQVSITTGGVITVTDERQFCRFATEVATENLADGAVTAAKISGGAVGASMLADGACLAEILDDDGSGSGLDADMVDGKHAADLMWVTNTPTAYHVELGQGFSTGATTFQGIDATRLLWNAAMATGRAVYFEVIMYTNAGLQDCLAEAKLVRQDNGADVANSLVSTYSNTPVRLRSSAITLTDGVEYKVAYRLASNPGGIVNNIAHARLVIQ